MITPQVIEELAPLYEELNFSEDPIGGRQAKLVFDSICRKLYAAESDDTRSKMSVQAYVAGVIVEEVLKHLKQRASKYPTIQPERRE